MCNELSHIAFLGFAERAAYVRDGPTDLYKWDVLGLKHVIVSALFPLRINGWYFGLALKAPVLGPDLYLRIKKQDGQEIGYINLATIKASKGTSSIGMRSEGPSLLVPEHGWLTFFFPLTDTNIVIPEPGIYLITLKTDGSEETIGQVRFVLLNPSPLTPARIAAIRSDPSAAKAVRAHFQCNKCQSELKAYAGLARNPKEEVEGYSWYQDLPDEFRCECGNALDLRIMRRNLFAPLGQPLLRNEEEISYTPLYERSSLETLLTEFRKLLDSVPNEETLQKFLEQNPILLHQFPAENLFFKPPILTFFKADLAIVTPQKELILIEIERSSTRLLKKDGGEAAPLRHAFDQVQSWLHTVDEYRLAVLDSLDINRRMVSSVRGVVIAGRDAGYDAEHLRRLKGIDRGRVAFLTYDDLAFSLAAIIGRMKEVWS